MGYKYRFLPFVVELALKQAKKTYLRPDAQIALNMAWHAHEMLIRAAKAGDEDASALCEAALEAVSSAEYQLWLVNDCRWGRYPGYVITDEEFDAIAQRLYPSYCPPQIERL